MVEIGVGPYDIGIIVAEIRKKQVLACLNSMTSDKPVMW